MLCQAEQRNAACTNNQCGSCVHGRRSSIDAIVFKSSTDACSTLHCITSTAVAQLLQLGHSLASIRTNRTFIKEHPSRQAMLEAIGFVLTSPKEKVCVYYVYITTVILLFNS